MKKTIYVGMLLSLALSSCDKDSKVTNEPDVPTTIPVSEVIYALTEGNFYLGIEGGLDAISISEGSVRQNVFKNANGRLIGDTPQCGVAYGSKIYVGTSESNTIEIINRSTFESIKQIKVSEITDKGQPYSMIADKGKVYISMFGGSLARLDTLTLTIDKVLPVGNNPDQIALHNGKIYVPISDGMSYPVFGKTAVIVNPSTMQIEKTFETELNPRQFISTEGRLFLLCMGNYKDIPAALFEVEPELTLKEITKATMAAAFRNGIAIINQPFIEEGEPVEEYKLFNFSNNKVVDWNISRPDYANAMYYDRNADCMFIASYVMSGQYPSYVLPGYINRYDAAGDKVVARYDLGSAGRATMFSLQK